MHCRRQQECAGGVHVETQSTKLTKSLAYDCGQHCEGPLLIDCCQKCRSLAESPQDLGVEVVTCTGCEQSALEKEASLAHCDVRDGQFNCKSIGHCTLGAPSETCSVTQYKCDIVPCSKCTDPTLRAACCEECLGNMCKPGQEDVVVCEGCAGEPEGAIWKWFPWQR
mmetsp:Transcript_32315/g.70558  ORF Transcript_32315/g.70558 Transcript_32315/m.70558 type:complete len:167 (+) Transcript_32315:3-503(+)